jgi:hypothetical protein
MVKPPQFNPLDEWHCFLRVRSLYRRAITSYFMIWVFNLDKTGKIFQILTQNSHLISISVTCLPTKPFTSLICLSYRCNFAESLSSTPSTIITTCDLFCFISFPHQSFPTYLPTTPPKSNPIPQNSL